MNYAEEWVAYSHSSVENVSEEWVSHCARSGGLVLESEPEEWVPHRRVTVVLVLWPLSTTPPRPEHLTDGVKTSEEWVPRLSDDTEEWVAPIAEWVSRCIRGRGGLWREKASYCSVGVTVSHVFKLTLRLHNWYRHPLQGGEFSTN